MHTCTKR